ncbi:bifunctional proline dehydrogenase/L-glutamate gamma-semialdehyde dehydrogenase PutA [Sessilibacter corallicola]|uniref:bifunctional proline dehydrogenase/L-glutamate gamma-semialdehyde dehydrogenase PutA n=1 Tax=Sessilibacter corallicola TaxID=2904075 RepID=UPI001E443207|nr:bifunctional proline dehydrogenase/L-glutamate gamma-semialdehyde dehydrogenase PutA [Sessilibacter corallicola]MCE2027583.1 bifunctional proline dehydrogenase/L-glutamate gamma-semialdehyde dehydrogenase PutA [Sessilibacter corallicola]
MCSTIKHLRRDIRDHYLADESQAIDLLAGNSSLSLQDRRTISTNAAILVEKVRSESAPSLMEKFLAEYGLSTKEGIALMCLAEALLRVPDSTSIDALIEDKVVPGNWKEHLGHSSSSLVNSSTWGLLITGKLLKENENKTVTSSLKGMVKRLGEPVVRAAVAQAMKELGRQFVLGRNVDEATKRASKLEKKGYTYSYDMLGEAARTDADAVRYHRAYSNAIKELTSACKHDDIRENPGISVKLSALHARYEVGQRDRVMTELVERTLELAIQAKEANMGFNIDAEEADRLDLSLDVIEAVLKDERLQGWDGFGIVVQAFGLRASFVLDWFYNLAKQLDRKVMVRLVKGAYWDTEIKRAQVLGLDGFPVFTRKFNSDLSYICCAEKLLAMTDRVYPQFATHNAHSCASVLFMAQKMKVTNYEFQRLHGMGESLHESILSSNKTRCRIYAPVGAHRDLLAYLVRRLLENGANSSFVNQIVDKSISPQEVAKDPFVQADQAQCEQASAFIAKPSMIFGEKRLNAKGWDITDVPTLEELDGQREAFQTTQWYAKPIIHGELSAENFQEVRNPANPDDLVGYLMNATGNEIETAIAAAEQGFQSWSKVPPVERAKCLRRIADLFEQNAPELFALACREAGKNLLDAVGEIREAVDFCRFYANEAERLSESESDVNARGIVSCISPWNFPLAIFSGQVLAGIAAGNAVLAKPAGQTPLIAARAVELMHEAGIPTDVLQLLPGGGSTVGAALTSDPRIAAVCFTGSTQTAQHINRVMADNLAPEAPLVAETGGLNAMIVDSTALPEQVVRDVLMSSFQSAGQRCSALRILYVQEDIADNLLEMLFGAMEELRLGNPWYISTDVGPVIDKASKEKIDKHCAEFESKGKLLKRLKTPAAGTFVAPTVLKVSGIEEIEEEIFGPVLHVATFSAKEIDKVVNDINAKGFGLTFGLHTRVDNRVDQIVNKIAVGNIYVNRNQIGAIVGSQPFGGEGLSGTGPKAGGPHYVKRFTQSHCDTEKTPFTGREVSSIELNQLIDQLDVTEWEKDENRLQKLEAIFAEQLKAMTASSLHRTEEMPGPTGELNLLSQLGRGVLVCLGPDKGSVLKQAAVALAQGNGVVIVAEGINDLLAQCKQHNLPVVGCEGQLTALAVEQSEGFAAIVSNANDDNQREIRKALALRSGALLPLITELDQPERYVIERHLCIDTTAAGGNANLISVAS